jgi:hypothetical protein
VRGMRETAAGVPPLRHGNICICSLFADARREAPGDSLIMLSE